MKILKIVETQHMPFGLSASHSARYRQRPAQLGGRPGRQWLNICLFDCRSARSCVHHDCRRARRAVLECCGSSSNVFDYVHSEKKDCKKFMFYCKKKLCYMFWYVLVHTALYEWGILVLTCTMLYWYVLVRTGMYHFARSCPGVQDSRWFHCLLQVTWIQSCPFQSFHLNRKQQASDITIRKTWYIV